MPSKPCSILCCLLLSACSFPRQGALTQEVASLQSQLGQARLQVQRLEKQRDGLAARIDASQALALQLQRDVVYLQTSNSQLADAVNRLTFEDWNKVVPDIQLRFSDVEGASQNMDTHTAQIVNALRSDNSE